MFYIALPLGSQIIFHKQAVLFNVVISAGSLVAPLWFTLSDVIAEIYGYQTSRNMFYGLLLVDLIFCILMVTLYHLPSPSNWTGEQSYSLVVGQLLKQYFANFIGLFLGAIVNIRLITRWQFLLNGRYFWLRSVGASIIGETIFTSLAFVIILYKSVPQSILISMILGGVLLKLVFNMIFSFPASILVTYLKKNGYADFLSKKEDFNPFI